MRPTRSWSALQQWRRFPEVLSCRRQTSQWLPLTLAYLGVRKLKYPCIVELRTGEHLTLSEFSDLTIFWLIFVRNHYPVFSSDKTIFDVGANVGFFSLYAARIAPSAKVVAFEPFPSTFERLRWHVEENRLSNRIFPVCCALSQRSGYGKMNLAPNAPSQYKCITSQTTEPLNRRRKGDVALAGQGVPVSLQTLTLALTSIEDQDIDLIKMNIHGDEYGVLLSTSPRLLNRVRRLVIQYHELPARAGLTKSHLIEHLKASGLEITDDRDTGTGVGLAVFKRVSTPVASPEVRRAVNA